MLEKCIALNNILYKDKHYRVDKIVYVDKKDVKKLEKQGAIKKLSKPKIHPVSVKLSYSTEKIKKFTKSKRKRKKEEK